jgi:DNA-directed RNA polymerase subunit beta
LIGRLASYARVNEYGFIETPYRKVAHSLPITDPDIMGRMLGKDIEDENGEVRFEEDQIIDEAVIQQLLEIASYRCPITRLHHRTD